jgi:hypothetical protein
MNRAQRAFLWSAALVVAVKLAQHVLLPPRPGPSARSLQWSGRVFAVVWPPVWWAGARDLRRRPVPTGCRPRILGWWHATGVLVLVPVLVMAATGWDTIWWIAALGGIGFFATAGAFTPARSID